MLDGYNDQNKQLVFKNQDGEKLSFSFKSFEDIKEDYSIGGLGPTIGSSLLFYYDRRQIKFEFDQYGGSRGDLQFKFNRFRDTLRGGITFPLWNTGKFKTKSVSIDFQGEKTQMSVNGISYNQVLTLDSGETAIEFEVGPFSRNVNILYYDLFFGLIGFDDLDGGEWRLQQ